MRRGIDIYNVSDGVDHRIADLAFMVLKEDRERDRLRAMLRIAIQAREDAEKYGSENFAPNTAAEPGGVAR